MDIEQTLLTLFTMKHDTHNLGQSFHFEIQYNEDREPSGVDMYKDGSVCWSETITDLLLWYVGQQLTAGTP